MKNDINKCHSASKQDGMNDKLNQQRSKGWGLLKADK